MKWLLYALLAFFAIWIALFLVTERTYPLPGGGTLWQTNQSFGCPDPVRRAIFYDGVSIGVTCL
jgi:hypothetical protein